jgi:hypothetical protein
MKKIPRLHRQLQLPDLFDWAANQNVCVPNYRTRRCRVPFATAETIIANADICDSSEDYQWLTSS